jgi:cytoskeletal protein RodZ
MNPSQQPPINEPNFEGEVMKIPSTAIPKSEPVKNTSLVNGQILLLLLAILVALLGGIYYWYTILMSTPVLETSTRPSVEENNEPESQTAEARTSATDVVSTSDELDAIAADLQSTEFTTFNETLTAVETELQAALTVSGE